MEKTIFIKTFGDTPKIKIWDFLLDNLNLDFTKSEIARQTGISRATLDRIWPNLVKDKIVMKSRIIGRAILFKVNTGNKMVRIMTYFDNLLITKSIKQEKRIKAQLVC